MKIEEAKVTTLKLMEIDEQPPIGRLDPITITLENWEPGRGQITIKCYDQAWTACWGAMNGKRVEQFFCSCNTEYLIRNLAPGLDDSIEDDLTAWEEVLLGRIIDSRRHQEISREQAREQYDSVKAACAIEPLNPKHNEEDRELIEDIVQDVFWDHIPMTANPAYEYMERVVLAVQKGLQATADA